MSLFKICNWWKVQCSEFSDNYECNSIINCRLGIETNEKDHIVVSSYTGCLNIFYPTSEFNEELEMYTGYQPSDLILEKLFREPILGIVPGKYINSGRSTIEEQLAILHPFKVSIYKVEIVNGINEIGKNTKLQLITEHKFKNAAFSMCKGRFGQAKGRDFICINHLNGNLSFFEQDGIQYEVFITDEYGIPSVLLYIERTDSFCRVNDSLELQSFSYQELSQSGINKSNVMPTWSLCIGDFPLDIQAVQVTSCLHYAMPLKKRLSAISSTKTSILILGEQNLISVTDEGHVEFIRKLDFSPKCFHCFLIGWCWEPDSRLLIAIVSDNGTLLIYEQTKLIWAAQFEDIPVAIIRSNLSTLPGAIMTIDSSGKLRAGFLGSEPNLFRVPEISLEEIPLNLIMEELANLEREIEEENSFNETEEDIDFQVNVLPNLVPADKKDSIKDTIMCSVCIQVTARIDIEEFQLTVNNAEGIKCTESINFFTDLIKGHSKIINLQFYLNKVIYITSFIVEFYSTFITSKGAPKVYSKEIFLPLEMFFKKVSAQKDGKYKITLTTLGYEKNEVLFSIMPIFADDFKESDMQAYGLSDVCNSETVSIIVAKSSKRIRIQSNCFEVLSALIEYITSNSQKHHEIALRERNIKATGSEQQKSIYISNFVPISEILMRIEAHYKVEQEIEQQTILIEALWNQLKLFQRSLKYKSDADSTSGLVMLIEKNYDDLVLETDHLSDLEGKERGKRNVLCCTIVMMRTFFNCLNISKNLIQSLKEAFPCPTTRYVQMSWPEAVSSACAKLLHQEPFSKKRQDIIDPKLHQSEPIDFRFDKFQRHLTMLLERITRIAADIKED